MQKNKPTRFHLLQIKNVEGIERNLTTKGWKGWSFVTKSRISEISAEDGRRLPRSCPSASRIAFWEGRFRS